MNKKELTSMLEEGLKIEEEIVPIYAMHINNTLFLSGLDKDKQDMIRDILNLLKKESEYHRAAYLNLLEKVRGDNRDVY